MNFFLFILNLQIALTWGALLRGYVCVCMCVRVCTCVIIELSILFRIFANSLITSTLYTYRFALIFVMWDYCCLFLCAGELAKSGVCDRVNQIVVVDVHLSEGVHDAL